LSSKQELKQKSKSKNKIHFLLFPVLVIALLVCGYNFIMVQVEISQKNAELAQISEKRMQIESDNQMLKRYSQDEFKIEYIESIARDKLNYAKAEERIYYIVPAN